LRVGNTVKHGDDKREGYHKADNDGGNYGTWDCGHDHFAVLRKMDGTIEARVHEVGIDDACQDDKVVKLGERP
jgi:hypothetical protein